ncbi:hypothetical protein KCP73_26305 [Salmonella enterica subsp. enterica]|nr:hypothetical protein KCP73_26305 [Salmonella enterica subsp. enterica]
MLPTTGVLASLVPLSSVVGLPLSFTTLIVTERLLKLKLLAAESPLTPEDAEVNKTVAAVSKNALSENRCRTPTLVNDFTLPPASAGMVKAVPVAAGVPEGSAPLLSTRYHLHRRHYSFYPAIMIPILILNKKHPLSGVVEPVVSSQTLIFLH